MKEKRYFCDWFFCTAEDNKENKALNSLFVKIVSVSIIVIEVVLSIIAYNIIFYKHHEELETYPESDYKYLDEVAEGFIDAGFDISTIPEDVKYDIYKKEDDIIIQYCLDNNEEKEFTTPASITITLSDKGEILSKEPKHSSKEEYIRAHKLEVVLLSTLYGFLANFIIVVVFMTCCVIAGMISKSHKNRDTKE